MIEILVVLVIIAIELELIRRRIPRPMPAEPTEPERTVYHADPTPEGPYLRTGRRRH